MSIIIDRRVGSGKKNTVNRQRFLRRYKKTIKEVVQEAINQRSITDTQKGADIHIPKRDVSEPVFHHGSGGNQQQVHPGNKKFYAGDRFKRPLGQGQGSGKGEASDTGIGVDDFVFQINREEFLHYLFEDLELPNLVRKELKDTSEYSLKHGGFTASGSPERLNVVRSLRAAHARRIALSGKERRALRELKRELREMEVSPDGMDEQRAEELRIEIKELTKKIKRLPFIDEFDLRFKNLVKEPKPTSKAVVFCIMDVSASMSQEVKDLAKRFFLLLYLFLERKYKALEVVFIRHHTEAKECTEEEFFYTQETGGTIVSKALELAASIISERFPVNQWNSYIAQASDGDNWPSDNDPCYQIIINKLMSVVQYYAYVEIADKPQAMWHVYRQIEEQFSRQFSQKRIQSQKDIYPVFRRLFEKREAVNGQ